MYKKSAKNIINLIIFYESIPWHKIERKKWNSAFCITQYPLCARHISTGARQEPQLVTEQPSQPPVTVMDSDHGENNAADVDSQASP